MSARLWLGSCVAAAVLAVSLYWATLGAAPPNAVTLIIPASNSMTVADSSALVGTPSCSARGCHGAVVPVASRPLPDCLNKANPASVTVVRQNEFSLWLARDRHAQAYQVLHGDLGQRILKNLYGEDKAKWNESVCLACHTNPLAAIPGDSAFLTQERLSGVGCESCHGAASRWLDAHTQPEWMCKTAEQKREYGMTPVGNPVVLAQTCVGCHVGAPAENGAPVRDMNHDMIAAGHPRLDFELSAFLANAPPHWDAKEQAKRVGPGYPARLWAVGQIVTAQAALNLLADRAREANPPFLKFSGSEIRATPANNRANGPWPEFSEYNCYACHHELTSPSWRQERGYEGRKAGTLPWGTWYSVMPRLLADRPPFGDDKSVATGFNALAKAMAEPQKDRGDLSAKAKELSARLTPLLAKANQTKWGAEEARELLATLEKSGTKDSAPDWDAAEQLYLAAAALSQDQGAERSAETLHGLVKMLAQPHAYRPEEFLREFQPSLKNLVEKH